MKNSEMPRRELIVKIVYHSYADVPPMTALRWLAEDILHPEYKAPADYMEKRRREQGEFNAHPSVR